MRFALGAVFIWFGALKIAAVTPVGTLVADTLRWVPINPRILVPALGGIEVILGALLVVGWRSRLVLAVLIAHLGGTFLVLIVTPRVAFQHGNPLILTTVGEFVVKNIVFIAAAVLLAFWPNALESRGTQEGR